MSTVAIIDKAQAQADYKSRVLKHVLLLLMFIGTFMAIMLMAKSAYADPVTVRMERVQIQSRVHALLTAYAADNQDAVIQLVDTQAFSFYGSDISEFAHTPAALRRMMTDDFKLWHTAKFGKPENLDIRVSRDMATAFFDVPFSAGGGPEVTVRLATVWRKVNGVWLLIQSANSVPTMGSSARELLRKMPSISRDSSPGHQPVHHII